VVKTESKFHLSLPHEVEKSSSLELELERSFNADFDIKSSNKVVVSKEFPFLAGLM